MESKNILVLGGSGFIGQHLIHRLTKDKHRVISCDIRMPDFEQTYDFEFHQYDLREQVFINGLKNITFDEIYQLAADMGGAGYVFSGQHDADILLNSAQINLNVLRATQVWNFTGRIFFASSACIYPQENQLNEWNPDCREESAYPANPDSDYGWEKLFGERMYAAFHRNKNLSIRIARFHNIYGPWGIFDGGKEKAPAAICRKVAQAKEHDSIEIWGDGNQTRSFLFIDDAIDALLQLMKSDFSQPLNIGSEEMVSINELAKMVIQLSGKTLSLRHVNGPIGVRGRNSSNEQIEKVLGWKVNTPLKKGLEKTYFWIHKIIEANGK
ncbi:MAG: NAD-dependent epimerase/dehydratase family protein [Flavobacteriales bacterium]